MPPGNQYARPMLSNERIRPGELVKIRRIGPDHVYWTIHQWQHLPAIPAVQRDAGLLVEEEVAKDHASALRTVAITVACSLSVRSTEQGSEMPYSATCRATGKSPSRRQSAKSGRSGRQGQTCRASMPAAWPGGARGPGGAGGGPGGHGQEPDRLPVGDRWLPRDFGQLHRIAPRELLLARDGLRQHLKLGAHDGGLEVRHLEGPTERVPDVRRPA